MKNFQQPRKIYELLDKLLGDFPTDNKLLRQQYTVSQAKRNQKYLLQDIDNELYEFDNQKLTQLKKMKKENLKKELVRIAKNFVKVIKKKNIDSIKEFKFDNMYSSCSHDKDQSFCKGKQLLIPADKFDDYIDIFAADLLNKTKQKWIFTDYLQDPVLKFYKFIKRPNEIITARYVEL